MSFNGELLAGMMPGQASEEKGMGRRAYLESARARAVYKLGSEVVGENLMAVCFDEDGPKLEGPIVQPALGAAITGDYFWMEEQGLEVDRIVPSSVSEVIGVGIGGGFSLEAMFKILKTRGIAMELAINEDDPSFMAALVGATADQAIAIVAAANRRLHRLKESSGVHLSTSNNKTEKVVAATRKGVTQIEKVVAIFKRKGYLDKVRVKVVRKGGAHSPFMEDGVDMVYEEVERAERHVPEVPVQGNRGIILDKPDEFPGYFSGQLILPEQFDEKLWLATDAGFRQFVEIGPQQKSTRHAKREFPDHEILSSPFGDIVVVRSLPAERPHFERGIARLFEKS